MGNGRIPGEPKGRHNGPVDEPPAPARPKAGHRYNGFISYSHALDGALAPALQRGLHQFAKPWYRIRAMRVFRDDEDLSANPKLWDSIVEALDSTEFFVLLASPEAARSKWVAKEVTHWCTHRDKEKFLIVLTEGQIAWDDTDGDFNWVTTTAIPPCLRGVFAREPRWIDLRWAREKEHLSLSDARFKASIAEIAAPLQGRDKAELIGEDARQHRRTRRLATAAIVGLALLSLATASGAVVAVGQRDQAQAQARLATSRAMASTATALIDSSYDTALLLAATSLQIKDTPQGRAALFSALERNPQHLAFLRRPGSSTATKVEMSADGAVVAAGDVDGTVSLWSVPDGRLLRELRLLGAGSVESLAIWSDRQVAAGSERGEIVAWDLATGDQQQIQSQGELVGAVAFSADGRLVASGDAKGAVLVAESATGAQVHRVQHRWDSGLPGVDRLWFSPDGRQLSVGTPGRISRWDLESGREVVFGGHLPGAHTAFSVLNRDLSLRAQSVGGGGDAVIVSSTEGMDGSTMVSLPGQAEALAFSADGQLLAVAGQGAIRLFDARSLTPDPRAPLLTGYPAPVSSVSFSANSRWMAAASGQAVVLSDLHRGHRVGRVVAESKEVCNGCLGQRGASVSPDGKTLAWLDLEGFSLDPPIEA